MRRTIILLAAVLSCVTWSGAWAIDYGAFLTILDPTLTVTTTPMSDYQPWCDNIMGNDGSDGNLTCIGGTDLLVQGIGGFNVHLSTPAAPRAIGGDALGQGYSVTGLAPPTGGSGSGRGYIYRNAWAGPAEALARLDQDPCGSHTCSQFDQFAATVPIVNMVDGTITMVVRSRACTGIGGCPTPFASPVRLIIHGLPKLFDVQLTFIPSGQAVLARTPPHPDGFRSADSLQVWTGDVRTMPDWSQATPLTCEAAVNPTPGQVVTVADTLPDPAVGHGRYYLTASVRGPDRRLGRQYVSNAFSARNSSLLPSCN